MATYQARMMDAATGGEGIYEFEDRDDLFSKTPVRIIRAFMEYIGEDLIPENYRDFELNAAVKNDAAEVVTGLGSLILIHDPPLPFAIMISPKAASAEAD